MLFISLEFIFFFLPITLIGFHLIERHGFKRTATTLSRFLKYYLQIDLIKNKQSIISLSNLETYLSLIENLAYSLDLEETLFDLNRMVQE